MICYYSTWIIHLFNISHFLKYVLCFIVSLCSIYAISNYFVCNISFFFHNSHISHYSLQGFTNLASRFVLIIFHFCITCYHNHFTARFSIIMKLVYFSWTPVWPAATWWPGWVAALPCVITQHPGLLIH